MAETIETIETKFCKENVFLESSFQFVFQTLFLLPTIILNFTSLNGTNDFDLSDLVNWKLLSILLSFGTFAFTTYKIRYHFFKRKCLHKMML